VVDKSAVVNSAPTEDQISDQALETSRLLVEFLHAAYATRNLDAEADAGAASGGPTGGGQEGMHAKTSVDVSTHAVRAAIHVHQHGDRTVGQLASGMGISYGWASRVVDELEAAGYLIRERDAADRRIERGHLNPAMRPEVERAYRWRGRAVEEALEPLNESEREAVRLFLRRVTELLLANQT